MNWLEESFEDDAGDERTAASDRLRVLVADDSRLVAEALMFTLDSDPRLDAIGYGLNGWEALELVASHEPDVILVGPALADGLDSFELARVVHELFPEVLVILLCERLVPAAAEAAYAIGVADFIPRSRSADELLHAISAARTRRDAFERGRQQEQRRSLHLVPPGDDDDRA
jgi:DNA-binding NarL/FixJ family response regulator